MIRLPLIILLTGFSFSLKAQEKPAVTMVKVDSGWAANSINTVIFRKNSLVTFNDTQFIAYYDKEGYVMIGKRNLNDTTWTIRKTGYRGNISDAHNCISIMTDGEGYLHIAWDHHGNALNYVRSIAPGSLELTGRLSMTGRSENKVTYPEFYKLKDGALLFMYRDGSSGQGNLVLDRYDPVKKTWTQIQSNLVDGEQQRNAYWQACVDKKGMIHISWVWRESPDVASNHDMCYARSADGGLTWEKSNGEKYQLPVTASSAEYIERIPQNSELINQASMCTDDKGNPFIASYWRDKNSTVPQYHIIYKRKNKWEVKNLGFRSTGFSLSGAGTKQIPVSRPQVIAWNRKGSACVALLFRDKERGNKVSAAISKNFKKNNWDIRDLSSAPVGSWEPTYDTELWKEKKIAGIFVQHTEQADAEGLTNTAPQMITVLEWDPRNK